MDITKEKIEQRRRELAKVEKKLKKDFIGIDIPISNIIRSIETWYVTPEILDRPVIVNLWGISGIGKTSLVRNLVHYLKLNEKYVEVSMDSNEGFYDQKSVQQILVNSGLDEGEAGIVLFDEFQRFKTLDEGGTELPNSEKSFQDIWGLLSDGQFKTNKAYKQRIMELILDEMYEKEKRKYQNTEEEDEDKDDFDLSLLKNRWSQNENPNVKYKQTYDGACDLRRILRLSEPVEEIMKWNADYKLHVAHKRLNDNQLSKPIDYSKMLVFIAGNLDEIYINSKNSEDADIDPDILKSKSKKLSLIDVKKALQERFTPEQIARLGNNHVIYPMPGKKEYEKIIRKTVNEQLKKFSKKLNVKISADNSIYKILYNNGVFPSQGVRPVFSTINSLLVSVLPYFGLEALNNNVEELHLYFDNSYICAKIKNKIYSIFVNCDLDVVRKTKISPDERMAVAVHEAGHAIVYGICYGVAPNQIRINASSNEGFVSTEHNFVESLQNIYNSVKVNCAGLAAEELIFGGEFIQASASSDLSNATQEVSSAVRNNGLNDFFSFIVPESHQCATNYNTNIQQTNDIIEEIVKESYYDAQEILKNNEDFLIKLASILFDKNEIEAEEFTKIARPYIGKVSVHQSDENISHNYIEMFNNYKKGKA